MQGSRVRFSEGPFYFSPIFLRLPFALCSRHLPPLIGLLLREPDVVATGRWTPRLLFSRKVRPPISYESLLRVVRGDTVID